MNSVAGEKKETGAAKASPHFKTFNLFVMQLPNQLSAVAQIIIDDWGEKIYFGAIPYVNAMRTLDSMFDRYGDDSAVNVVSYFLANAQTWHGSIARNVKAHLNQLVRESR